MKENQLTTEELNVLYNKAKDAYYNTGNPIMSDAEFDELEQQLKLANNSYIGSKSQNYNVKHPFIMGSISKVQIKKDKNGIINFDDYADDIRKYLKKSKNINYTNWTFETTPKLDGVSFEVNISATGNLISVATRGDGDWGKDIKPWFELEWERNFKNKISNWINKLNENDSYVFLKNFVIRGEILIDKNTFLSKYANDFTIPRSFVSGVINSDWEGTDKQIEMRNDLSWICYDYREVYDNGVVVEIDYNNTYPGEIIDYKKKYKLNDLNILNEIYYDYENYRKHISRFELDGIVIKPVCWARLNDLNRVRQEDCVAIKFTPEIVESIIENIEWSVSKTGEYFPTAIIKEIILMGKKVNRASLHNYGYIINNNAGIGSVVKVSLAGDIIPYIIDISKTADIDNINIPNDSYIIEDAKSASLHLMKNFTEEEKEKNQFLSSAKTLNIPFIGPAAANTLWDMLHEDICPLINIIQLMRDDFDISLITEKLGDGKSIKNIITSLHKYKEQITLEDIIESFCFKSCGTRASKLCAKIIRGEKYSTASMAAIAYQWALDSNSQEYQMIINAATALNISLNSNTNNYVDVKEKIPVILTGDPSKCSQYSTKAKFLEAHPEYELTNVWKECKILFTNDLESKTGKMQKAIKANISIKLYE